MNIKPHYSNVYNTFLVYNIIFVKRRAYQPTTNFSPYGIYLVYRPSPLHHPDKHHSGWQ